MKNTKQVTQSLTPTEISKKLLAIEKQRNDLDTQVKELQQAQLAYQVFGTDKLEYLLDFDISAFLTSRTNKPETSIHLSVYEIAPKGVLWCVNSCRLSIKQLYGCSWSSKIGYNIYHELKQETSKGAHENLFISRNHDQCQLTLRCALTKAQFELCKKLILTTDYEKDNVAEELFNAITAANIPMKLVQPHELFSSLEPLTGEQQKDINTFLVWHNQPGVIEE